MLYNYEIEYKNKHMGYYHIVYIEERKWYTPAQLLKKLQKDRPDAIKLIEIVVNLYTAKDRDN